MDIRQPGFSKGTGCEFLYKHLNIKRENTYAFGDDYNDLEMLELIGHGIAMGNAIDEAKAVAFDITDTVFNDGIAKAFKKYFHI